MGRVHPLTGPWPRRQALFALALTAASPSVSLAQGGSTGSILGNVFDQSGSPLRGIKVVASSDTQIGGPKTAYTNDEGFFRFPALLPGTFDVTASAPGMKSVVQQAIKVGVNAAVDVPLVLEVETAQEEVKIVERAPIVSTTHAGVKDTYDEEFMDSLPLDVRQNIEEFASTLAPGAVKAGDRLARIRGGNQEQNAFMVDGFYLNRQKTTFKSLAAMEVQTAAYGAEGVAHPGGIVSMVTKSGSNKYEFDLSAFHENSRFQFFRDNPGPAPTDILLYVNPNLSGPIIKDKLWFYVNAETRYEYTEREDDPTGFFPTPPPRHYANVRGTAKLTWQITPRNRLQSFTLLNRDGTRNREGGLAVERDAQSTRDRADYFSGLTWEALLTDTVFFRSQAGITQNWQETAPQRCLTEPVECLHIAPVQQTFPQTINLVNYTLHAQNIYRSLEFINTLEWFKNSALGEHAVKLTSRLYNRTVEDAVATPGDAIFRLNGGMPDRKTTFFSNDPRLEQPRYGYRITQTAGRRWVNTIQDSIRATRFLTLNPGVGLTFANSENNRGDTIQSAFAVTPHLSVVWDPTHDGRSALRASFNNYVDPDPGRLAAHALGGRVSQQCRWNATTSQYDTDCEYSGGISGATIGLPCGPQGTDEYGNTCRRKLKIPRTWEYTLGAEREIIQGVALGLDFVYRDFRHPYNIRETNRIWNNSGSALQPTGAYRNGVPQTINDLGTPDEGQRNYRGVTLILHKREGKAKINTSYTWSKLRGNTFDLENGAWGDIPPRDVFLWGYLPDDARHALKTTATYQWTSWFSTGFTHQYRSGTPYDRRYFNSQTGGYDNYRARVGVNPGNNINDPNDDRETRLPDFSEIALQLRLNLKPLLGQALDVYADVINVLNNRTVMALVEEDGARYGQPVFLQNPMRARLGIRFRY